PRPDRAPPLPARVPRLQLPRGHAGDARARLPGPADPAGAQALARGRRIRHGAGADRGPQDRREPQPPGGAARPLAARAQPAAAAPGQAATWGNWRALTRRPAVPLPVGV